MTIELTFKQFMKLNEEPVSSAASNVTGGGEVGGTDTMAAPTVPMHMFANCAVFDVCKDRYHKCIQGKKQYDKYENYVGNDEIGEAIRQYGRKYPNKSIIVREKDTHAMVFLRRK